MDLERLASEMMRAAEAEKCPASSRSLAARFLDRINNRRAAGISWTAIASEIAKETGLPINTQSLAKGFRSLSSKRPKKPASRTKRTQRSFTTEAARLMFPSLEALRQSGKSWSEISVELSKARLFTLSPMNIKSLWERGHHE